MFRTRTVLPFPAPRRIVEIVPNTGPMLRSIRFQQIGIENYRAMLLARGLADAQVQGLIDMAVAQNDGIDDGDLPARTAIGFRRWYADALRPAVPF